MPSAVAEKSIPYPELKLILLAPPEATVLQVGAEPEPPLVNT